MNLDFEATTISLASPPGYFSKSDALPGWNVFLASEPQSQVWYNNPRLGAEGVTLLGAQVGPVIEGSFTLLLQGGYVTPVTIAQTGFIPAKTASLQIKAIFGTYPAGGENRLVLSLNGQPLATTVLATVPGAYTLYAADVLSFAGMNAELRITAPPWPESGNYNYYLDSIEFRPVPEPSMWALLGLGSVLLAAWHVRQKRNP
ncbi:MAG: PEP-CTERM sorting domain-containing protein [Verrucomicrobia bacterium]|nr:PEP-CTERM sorting domain-containing protein [Verrucomicrobiota bacterium]